MINPRTIAVASGKGGTGKTTVATNLALHLAQSHKAVQYVDCDVEEPNGHIFLQPTISTSIPVTVSVPEVDLAKCTGCGKCSKLCQYKAIVTIKDNVLTFEQLCHSCGGCTKICPVGAIREKPLPIGQIESGSTDSLEFLHGRLEIGSVRSPSLIHAVRQQVNKSSVVIIDAPPGTSCPVIASVQDADYVLLVTEPTPFGLHDLTLAVGMVRQLAIPFGVLINRSGLGDDRTQVYCRQEQIDIIAEIPDDRRIAQAYSTGRMILDAVPEVEPLFAAVAERIVS